MSTHKRFVKLLAKGKRVRCSRMGTYFHLTETNPDSRGGRISKIHDVFIHDQTVEQSRFKKGKNWVRGIYT